MFNATKLVFQAIIGILGRVIGITDLLCIMAPNLAVHLPSIVSNVHMLTSDQVDTRGQAGQEPGSQDACFTVISHLNSNH